MPGWLTISCLVAPPPADDVEELRSLFGQAIGLAPPGGSSVHSVARKVLHELRPADSAAEVVESCCQDWDDGQFGSLLAELGQQGGDHRCASRHVTTPS